MRASATVDADATLRHPCELGQASVQDNVTFTPGSFPTGQRVVVYNYGYGFGPDDIGGAKTPSDVLSGNFPCVDTRYVSAGAPAGQTSSSALSSLQVGAGHAVRYVDGTCRVSVPYLPLFREFVGQIPVLLNQVPKWRSTDHFQSIQPQFLSDGSNLKMGLTYEALLKASIGGVGATASFDPPLSVGLRSTTACSRWLSWPTTLLSRISAAAALPTRSTRWWRPRCRPSKNQCRFHPVSQAVNVLPDRLEVVLAPDLRNATDPINDLLTQFFSLVGPQSLTVPVTLGGSSVPVTLDCSIPAAGAQTVAITTVFEGDSNLATGIACGAIAQQ